MNTNTPTLPKTKMCFDAWSSHSRRSIDDLHPDAQPMIPFSLKLRENAPRILAQKLRTPAILNALRWTTNILHSTENVVHVTEKRQQIWTSEFMHNATHTHRPLQVVFLLASFWTFLPAPKCTSGIVCSSFHPCTLWSSGSTCMAAHIRVDGTLSLQTVGATVYHLRLLCLNWPPLRRSRQCQSQTSNQCSHPESVLAAIAAGPPHKAAVRVWESYVSKAAGGGILSKRNKRCRGKAYARGPMPACFPTHPRRCPPPCFR